MNKAYLHTENVALQHKPLSDARDQQVTVSCYFKHFLCFDLVFDIMHLYIPFAFPHFPTLGRWRRNWESGCLKQTMQNNNFHHTFAWIVTVWLSLAMMMVALSVFSGILVSKALCYKLYTYCIPQKLYQRYFAMYVQAWICPCIVAFTLMMK